MQSLPLGPHLLLITLLVLAAAAAGGSNGTAEMGFLDVAAPCGGGVGECLRVGEGEWGMSRRILDGSWGYISYGALQSDSVPCSRRGQSYYNCQAGAAANPYDRGCSAITQCRS